MTGVQTCALPICFPVTIGVVIIMNFETEISGLTAGQIQRLGLAVGDNLLFTTANTGGISVSNTPIFVLYQIRLGITQG